MEKKFSTFRPVSQEHPMGCAVACVASLCRLPYRRAIELFEFREHAWTRGFYCSEVVQALSAAGLDYIYEEFASLRHSRHLRKTGTIVFVAPCVKYPSGHYLLRLPQGWMNPWANFPSMSRVRPAVEKKLPGKISYLVYAK
jgi:hypothetical protein